MSESSLPHPLALPLPLALPHPGGWDAALLEPVTEINEWLLQCLRRRSLARDAAESRPPALLELLGEEWRALEPAGLQRLAACPYLLLQLGVPTEPGCTEPPGRTAQEATGVAGYFPGEAGIALVRRALIFAWHIGRANRLVARIVLGLPPEAVERIAGYRLQALDGLAEQALAWARPRWAAQPAIWRQLLQAARHAPMPGLRAVQLRGLQLMAAELP